MSDTTAMARFVACRKALLDKGELLKAKLPATEAAQIEQQILDKLRRNRFDIAVVGQMKAGKSTFLNALMERPELLPADVNPWTAVVTCLHFGLVGAQHETGTFQFYNQDEWQDICLHGGRRGVFRKLVTALGGTEGAPPGAQDPSSVPVEELQELESQRRRIIGHTEHSLGQELQGLLGQSMSIAKIDRHQLEPFLVTCPESEGYSHDNPAAGRYSGITRQADLYFPREPFEEYCVIVDTPGVNDPIPFREELTWHYVTEANAFVVVLTALRPFDRYDAEFLTKLLRGLRKERLLVFVNQIDRLAAPRQSLARDASRVLTRVQEMIKKTFPEHDIPVLSGSAMWGEIAMKRVPSDLTWWLHRPEFIALGIERQYFTNDQVQMWHKDVGQHTESIAKAIWRASGVGDMREALNRKVLQNKGEALLYSVRDTLVQVTQTFAGQRRQEAQRHKLTASRVEQGLASVEAERQRLQKCIDDLQKNTNEIDALRAKAGTSLNGTADHELNRLRNRLMAQVTSFANDRTVPLVHEGISVWGESEWKVPLEKCRTDLEKVFRQHYENARGTVLKEEEHWRDQLRRQLSAIDPSLGDAVNIVPPGDVDPSPSMIALKRTTVIDLGNWWSRLWSGKATARSKSDELRKIIIQALTDVIDELIASARGALVTDSIGTLIGNLEQSIRLALNRLASDLQSTNQLYSTLVSQNDPVKLQAAIEEQKNLVVRCDAEAQAFDGLMKDITNLPLPQATKLPQ